jgi:hypothetical protein
MSRNRFGIVFILLVLILLVVSTLFGVLTYWLDAEAVSPPSPGQGGMLPVEHTQGSGREPRCLATTSIGQPLCLA